MSKYGINTNNVSPGFVKTSFYKKFKKDKKKLVEVKNGDHSLSNSKHVKILLRELKVVIKNFI